MIEIYRINEKLFNVYDHFTDISRLILQSLLLIAIILFIYTSNAKYVSN